MQNTLKNLFDFQKFQENSHLARVIAESEACYGKALDDDAMLFVNAAGEYSPLKHAKDGDDFNA